MTQTKMSTESVLPDASEVTTDKERMHQYRIFAAAFSYPDKSFFDYFPDLLGDKQSLMAEYIVKNKGSLKPGMVEVPQVDRRPDASGRRRRAG